MTQKLKDKNTCAKFARLRCTVCVQEVIQADALQSEVIRTRQLHSRAAASLMNWTEPGSQLADETKRRLNYKAFVKNTETRLQTAPLRHEQSILQMLTQDLVRW